MYEFCKNYGFARLIILTTLLFAAFFGLFMLKDGGYESFVASLDKPSAQYGDFHEYYYPVGKFI